MRHNFLVTGANGFVGKTLCAELLRQGQPVRAAVRSASSPIDGIEVAAVGAIDGETNWADALRDVDVVIHLAARVHVTKDKAADPLAEFLKVNTQGTANLAYQAAAAGVKRLVYVSSIKVNGEGTLSPDGTTSHSTRLPNNASQVAGYSPSPRGGGERDAFAESDKPDPQDAYAISKWRAEQALQRVAQETGLEVVIVRPPLVYGPGVKGNFIRLLAAVDKGIPLPLASVRNKRSLIYLGNLADVLMLCATHPAAAGKTYLVRDGEDISIPDLVRQMATGLGRPARLFPLPVKLLRGLGRLFGDLESVERIVGSLCVNDDLIRKELSWKPRFTLQQGLQATALWYRAQYRSSGIPYLKKRPEDINPDNPLDPIPPPPCRRRAGEGVEMQLSRRANPYQTHPHPNLPPHGEGTIALSPSGRELERGHCLPPYRGKGQFGANGLSGTNADCHVSVVIVNYNAGEILLECVARAQQQAEQIIVVDNASTDNSIAALRNTFPAIRIIRNERNLGFASACNLGAQVADGNHILFLNPDCILDPDAVLILIQAVNSAPDVSMVGGLLINPDGTEQVGARRAVPTPWRSFVRAFGFSALSNRYPRLFSDFALHKQPLPDHPIEVEAISGACMLVRRDALEEVGLLDEGYFMHCEDLDWCMRFRQKGWKILFVPDARMIHHKGHCSKSRPIFIEWHKHKGMIRFYHKFFRHQYPGLLMGLVTVGVWARFIAITGYYLVDHSLRKLGLRRG